jgi:hypothetical protein
MSRIRIMLVSGALAGAALGAAAGVAQDKAFPEKTRLAKPPVKEAKPIDESKPDAPASGGTKSADTKTEDPPISPTKSAAPRGEKVLRVHLMEGSVVSGKLSVNSITVDTEFGKLEIPVSRIVSFTPGMDSHPKEREQLRVLILQLGANDKALRDDAEKQLASRGASVKRMLEQFSDDKDTERRNRVKKILDEIDQQSDEEDGTKQAALIDDDTITTSSFTMVGKISPQSFQVQTKFGPLTVNLADIRRAEHESDEKPMFQKTIDVQGNNLVMRNPLNTGIKVNKGDKISIEASGNIVMSPWGSESLSGPEGSPNYGQYRPGINGGALCMKYGANGQDELVGRSKNFVATKSATLYLAVAMQPNYGGSGYQFPGSYKVKVRVNPQ